METDRGRGYRKLAVSWDFAESGMERSADGDILSSVWNSRRQVVEKTAGEEGYNKEIREKSGEIRRRKGMKRPATEKNSKRSKRITGRGKMSC